MARSVSSILMQILRKREQNRGDRAEAVQLIPFTDLTVGQRQDVRAAQRTFEGAFLRTAAGQLSFGLVILKLFSQKFTPIGIIYMVNCILMLIFGMIQRRKLNRLFLTQPSSMCRTAGSTVLFTTVLTLLTNTALLIVLFRLDNDVTDVRLFENYIRY